MELIEIDAPVSRFTASFHGKLRIVRRDTLWLARGDGVSVLQPADSPGGGPHFILLDCSRWPAPTQASARRRVRLS